jgi:hypothetical protein
MRESVRGILNLLSLFSLAKEKIWQSIIGSASLEDDDKASGQANRTAAGIPNFWWSTFAILKVNGFLRLSRADT